MEKNKDPSSYVMSQVYITSGGEKHSMPIINFNNNYLVPIYEILSNRWAGASVSNSEMAYFVPIRRGSLTVRGWKRVMMSKKIITCDRKGVDNMIIFS